jgi:hypothetical protein
VGGGRADLVLRGGRVIDPESGLDAVADVAVTGGRVTAGGAGLPPGRAELGTAGQVVTAGFIDLHSHVNGIAGLRLQALDGVTTALELEAGVTPVAAAYDRAAAQGRPVNYGFATSWALARMEAVAGVSLDGSLAPFLANIARLGGRAGHRSADQRWRPGWKRTWPTARWASGCWPGTRPAPTRPSTSGWRAWPRRPGRPPSRTHGT